MTIFLDDIIRNKTPSEQISDADLKKLSYAIEYFEFYGETDVEDLIYWEKTKRILKSRLKDLEQKQKSSGKKSSESSILSGQLWEKCEICKSNAPVYMSHGCCEKCAKKN